MWYYCWERYTCKLYADDVKFGLYRPHSVDCNGTSRDLCASLNNLNSSSSSMWQLQVDINQSDVLRIGKHVLLVTIILTVRFYLV